MLIQFHQPCDIILVAGTPSEGLLCKAPPIPRSTVLNRLSCDGGGVCWMSETCRTVGVDASKPTEKPQLSSSTQQGAEIGFNRGLCFPLSRYTLKACAVPRCSF